MNDERDTSQFTHFRRAFDSPYLSSLDIVGPTRLTIARVVLERDKSKRTRDEFNTAYFVERDLRPGEKLKPMILNATNSKFMQKLTGSPWLDDWQNVEVLVYVDQTVKFGADVVGGLRISRPVGAQRATLTPAHTERWASAVEAVRRERSLDPVLSRIDVPPEYQRQLLKEAGIEYEAMEEARDDG